MLERKKIDHFKDLKPVTACQHIAHSLSPQRSFHREYTPAARPNNTLCIKIKWKLPVVETPPISLTKDM